MVIEEKITERTGKVLGQLKDLSHKEETGKDANRTLEWTKKLSRKPELPHGVWKTSLLYLLSVWFE